MPLQLSPADLLGRVNRDVERSYLRARNGLRYVRGSNRPGLGTTPKDYRRTFCGASDAARAPVGATG